MKNKADISPVFCLYCTDSFVSGDSSSYFCPKCEHSISKDKYNTFLKHAEDAVEFGYHYRLTYECDLATGDGDSRYSLVPLGEVFVWLGLVVSSGIVGNASWDLIKEVARRAISKFEDADEFHNACRMLDNEQDWEQFCQYLHDYASGLNNVDSKLKSVLLEEIIVHAMVDKHFKKQTYTKVELTDDELREVWKHIDLNG